MYYACAYNAGPDRSDLGARATRPDQDGLPTNFVLDQAY